MINVRTYKPAGPDRTIKSWHKTLKLNETRILMVLVRKVDKLINLIESRRNIDELEPRNDPLWHLKEAQKELHRATIPWKPNWKLRNNRRERACRRELEKNLREFENREGKKDEHSDCVSTEDAEIVQ